MKSGNLNFLEPSGPRQACNGTDLPLPLPNIYNNGSLEVESVAMDGDCHILPLVHMIQSVLQPRR